LRSVIWEYRKDATELPDLPVAFAWFRDTVPQTTELTAYSLSDIKSQVCTDQQAGTSQSGS